MNIRPLLGLFLFLLPCAARAQTVIPRFGKFEATFTLPNQTGNPFDPADNDVDAVVTGPHGLKAIQPAFWDGDRWRVRFAPPAAGAYALRITRNGANVVPADLSSSRFQCVPSSSPGFIRRDPVTSQRFVFDNGQTYYPLGMDAAWLNAGQTYADTFTHMQAAHMNWARVWVTVFDGKNFEWAPNKADDPKPGTLLLSTARRWDDIFNLAEAHGIYIQMTLQHHGQYTAHTDPNWADNPFNAANGGFLQKPDDFFTDAEARRLTRLKYRYITARYGYSTHLLSYELFNEVQNITEAQTHFQDVVAWHKEMASAIRREDVNHHLLTTSNSVPGDPLAKIGLDYDQIHSYVPDIISLFAGLQGAAAPVFTGEWGPSGDASEATEGFLHDGLWASLMAPTAGAGQFWAWDAVEAKQWWPQFASASAFLKASGVPTGLKTLQGSVDLRGALGDLSFAPSTGWGPFTRDTVFIASGGRLPDLSGLSSFFQGSSHKEMRPHPITFLLDCPTACEFILSVGTVSKSGAHPVLTLNGKPAGEADFPATPADHDAGKTLSISLPAGSCRVTLDNTGPDWFTVQRLTVTQYAPSAAVLAKGSPHNALFWVYRRDRSAALPVSALLHLPGLAPGVYTIRLWDTWAGAALPPVHCSVQEGALSIKLPPFTHDIAGSVSLKTP